MECSRRWTSTGRTLLFVAGLCFVGFVSAQEEDGLDYALSSYYDRTCTFERANKTYDLLHGEQILLDPCTTCTCRDGIANCVIKNCRAVTICGANTEWIIVPWSCCPQCPNKMYVDNVNITHVEGISKFAAEEMEWVRFGLRVVFDRELSTAARGKNFWKLSAWISKYSDGSRRRYSYNRNVFSKKQASKNFNVLSRRPCEWSDLDFALTFKGKSCKNYKYFCVEFDQSDDPRPHNGLPFTFQPVNNDRRRLMDCIPLHIDCRGNE